MQLLLIILYLLLDLLAKYWRLQINSSPNNFPMYSLLVVSKSSHKPKRYWLGNWLRNDHTA